MKIGIYPGTFDPLTNGHLDIINRATNGICDKLIIAIGINPGKKPFFSLEERIDMIRQVLDMKYPNHKDMFDVQSFDGLLVNFAQEQQAQMIVRGIRNVSDFEYEINLANINLTLNPHVQTIFLSSRPELTTVSSSAVKELAKHKADIFNFVPQLVAYSVYNKYKSLQT